MKDWLMLADCLLGFVLKLILLAPVLILVCGFRGLGYYYYAGSLEDWWLHL